MKSHLRDQLIGLGILAVLSMSGALVYVFVPSLRTLCGGFYPVAAVAIFVTAYGFFSIAYLKILNAIVPLREGGYDMDHDQFILWKHQAVIANLGREALKYVVPMFLRNVYFKLLGTKMGSNVVVAEGATILDPFLTEIGANAIIGQNAVLTAHTMVPGSFFLRPVIVAEGATIGINSVLMPGVEVGAGSVVAPGSIVTMGTKIPDNEFWGGIPAKKISNRPLSAPASLADEHTGIPVRQPSGTV